MAPVVDNEVTLDDIVNSLASMSLPQVKSNSLAFIHLLAVASTNNRNR